MCEMAVVVVQGGWSKVKSSRLISPMVVQL